MLFNSYAFIFLFLPLFIICWQYCARFTKDQALFYELTLLIASCIFYGLWGLPYLFLLAFMLCLNYFFGLALANSTDPKAESGLILSRRTLFILAICLNLLPLLWFKYSWFVIQNLALLFQANWRFTPPGLPLGISFYTFIQIAWLTGIYRSVIQPVSLRRHAVFSAMFPYVISGPIMRYEQLGWQLDKLNAASAGSIAAGITLFVIGLAKKVILADSIGIYADAVFNAAEKFWPITCLEAWLGSFCYTFQLYFDFSGYTDMALGIGLMIGLRLPENFNSPYKSTGIVDFWRRWHITLSAWLRDFLYIPLGGNRHGKLRQYRNLFLTMLIGGIWHGSGWTFMIWGALHGIMLSINHFFRATIRGSSWEKYLALLPARIFFILLTFFCLDLCWVVFRALSLDGAYCLYSAMFGGYVPIQPATNAGLSDLIANWLPNHYFNNWQPFVLLGGCALLCWLFPNSQQIISGESGVVCWRPSRAWATAMAVLTFICLILLSRQSVFLYFQF